MKKRNLKSLQLGKKAIAKINTNEIKGKGWTTISTIQEITNSCPRNCGSVK